MLILSYFAIRGWVRIGGERLSDLQYEYYLGTPGIDFRVAFFAQIIILELNYIVVKNLWSRVIKQIY